MHQYVCLCLVNVFHRCLSRYGVIIQGPFIFSSRHCCVVSIVFRAMV